MPLSRAGILFVDPDFLSHTLVNLHFVDTCRIHAVHSEEEALQHLRDQSVAPSAIVGNHRMLRRINSDLVDADLVRHRHLVRLLLTDGSEPHEDFAAVNQAAVFRILERSTDPILISQHLREAMDLHARLIRASHPIQDSGAALRDAFVFLAHEINTPLSVIQGYAHAMVNGSGGFSEIPALPDTLRHALKATERNAKRCLNLMAFIAETAQCAFSRRETVPYAVSDQLQALLNAYPFVGKESDWISVDVGHDFQLGSRSDLLQLVLFVLTHRALQALRDSVRPRLRITLSVQENMNCIGFSDNGRSPPVEAKNALNNKPADAGHVDIGLLFCRSVMQSMRGEFRIVSAPGQETVATLRFRPVG